MRVLLIGATGVLGRAAVPELLAAGHQVTGLARSAERAAAVRGLGVEPVVADLFDADSLAETVRGQEAVLNLATRIPTGVRAVRPGGWAENDRLRAEGTRMLVDAALAGDDVRVIVQEGVSFVYVDGGDAELTEQAPIDPGGPTRSSVLAHANVARFADAGRVAVRLRIGALHGDDAMTRMALRAARSGLPVVFGDPAGWTTAIHPDDAAAGAVAALDAPSGVYNVGANPVRKSAYGAVIAAAAGAKRARTLPAALARGPLAIFARSHRVVSHALTEATGWRPKRPEPAVDWFPSR